MTAAIAARLYPFPPARELYLVTKGEPDAAIVDLYRWILTDGQALVGDAGFVTLSPDRLTEAQALIGE